MNIKKDYPVFCFIGSPQAGKSTAAKMMAERTGLKRGTCSDIIYRVLSKMEGLPPGDWHEVTPEDQKEVMREKLIRLGNAISDEMPHVYPSLLLSHGCGIIDGMRKKKEMTAFKDYCDKEKIRLNVIWIARPDSPAIEDNTEITPSDAHHMMCATDMDDLREAIDKLASSFETKVILKPRILEGTYHNVDTEVWDVKVVTPKYKCPLCGAKGVWRSGVHFDHQMRCVNDDCSGGVWIPDEKHTVLIPKPDE